MKMKQGEQQKPVCVCVCIRMCDMGGGKGGVWEGKGSEGGFLY